MNERPTSSPRKFLLSTFAVVTLAAGTAHAQPQPNSDERAGDTGAPPADSAGAVKPAEVPPPGAPLPPPAYEEPPAPDGNGRKRLATEEMPRPAEIPTTTMPGETTFTRTPLKVTVGPPNNAWSFTLFGIVQADYIADSTRSYDEPIGPALVARSDTYEGTVGRTMFSMRNSRLGFVLESPTIGGVSPSAVLQGDWAGNQPGNPYPVQNGTVTGMTLGESPFHNSPTFRIRYAYMTLRNRVADVVAGETVDVFGWQSYYSLCSMSFVPNQVSSRNTQLRLSRSFLKGAPVNVDIALEAGRPVQRDSQVPDFSGALRFSVDGWKGITTPGNAVTIAAPLSVSVSGIGRQFKVNAFTPPPAQSSNSITGWGVSIDAFLPVIPATNADDRSNKLTLIGSYVVGTGIADLIVSGGGAKFPTLPNPAQASPPPIYTPDVDNGLVSFDTIGQLHTIDWWAAKGGLQYYAPGRFILSLNATYSQSKNMAKLFPKGGAEIELLGAVADKTMYGEATLLWDATPSVRFGLSGQYTRVHYLDGNEPHNIRAIGQALYIF
jgi:hypothetical protein